MKIRELLELSKYLVIHNITPEKATQLRESLLKNRRQVVLWKMAGEIDDNRLRKIQRETETKSKFLKLIEQELKGGLNAINAVSEIESLSVDLQAGYFQFKEVYLSKKHKMQFVSDEDGNGF